MHLVREDLLRAFYKLFYLRFCVTKILQGILETNSYKFSYKFTFIPFLCFYRNQKQEPNFQQVGGLVTRNSFVFSLKTHHAYSTMKRRESDRFYVVSTWKTREVSVGLFIACRALLQRYAKFNELL